ncbi:hypothetical protein GZH47_09185 [Paenibacillus rhizovicinus]|uniref:Thiazole-containing bacteriocin maturation protein n=1 Tax=Paenibacillus rhizovicinus TaxID=2704463 RepID=A0A6C0NXT8_9BACL|nr:hypothetical protein [Paenibacillus rhizovicinus]QHW31008.1 hypothetical protein GZH47_09185 [Paenibacillus rhizovicinus]
MSSQDEEVLAVGSGAILVSLVKAWYASGLTKVNVLVANAQSSIADELQTVKEQALLRDSEAELNILALAASSDVDWAAAVQPFSFILYAAQHGDLTELQQLQSACIACKKPLLPAMFIGGMCIAGPLLRQEGDSCPASAWRRLHASVFPADPESQPCSAAALSLLTNLTVNEWLNAVSDSDSDSDTDSDSDSGTDEIHCSNHCYVLHPLTLEGDWHPILPHPVLSGYQPARIVTDVVLNLEDEQEPAPEEWFEWFNGLTSEVSGIFRAWEEGALRQLPLAQCLVQPADPLSERPASLLPAIVGSGLTHVDARRDSALAGMESYVSRLKPLFVPELPSSRRDDVWIGAGLTFAEAAERGLHAYLTQELGKRPLHHGLKLARMDDAPVEDLQCQYLLRALTILEGEPRMASGEPLLGFPVAWVRSGAAWHGGVGLNMTLALRQSLQNALMQTASTPVASVIWNDHLHPPQSVAIPSEDPIARPSWIRSAIHTLRRHRKRLEVFDLRCESFLSEGPIAVVGILLGEEESP